MIEEVLKKDVKPVKPKSDDKKKEKKSIVKDNDKEKM